MLDNYYYDRITKKTILFYMKISYDILGNIIIAKFPDKSEKSEKIKEPKKLLNDKKSVETILEKKEDRYVINHRCTH